MRRYGTNIIILSALSFWTLLIFDACGQKDGTASDSSSSNQGVWSINLNGTAQVVAALHQEEGHLFGSEAYRNCA